MTRRITPAALARAADVNRVWAAKAIQLGLIPEDHLGGDDVIALRVFALADQIVWPGDRRSRSDMRTMTIWHGVVVSSARDALVDKAFNANTLLWLTKERVYTTHTLAEALVQLSDPTLAKVCSMRIPLGVWAADLPKGFELAGGPHGSAEAVQPPLM